MYHVRGDRYYLEAHKNGQQWGKKWFIDTIAIEGSGGVLGFPSDKRKHLPLIAFIFLSGGQLMQTVHPLGAFCGYQKTRRFYRRQKIRSFQRASDWPDVTRAIKRAIKIREHGLSTAIITFWPDWPCVCVLVGAFSLMALRKGWTPPSTP